jgi:hypothetical protein
MNAGNSNIAQIVAALRAKQAPAPVAPNYVPQMPNLNPNLAKNTQRVQLKLTGMPKPDQADWG